MTPLLFQMQSFGWKRKAGLTKPKPAVFSQDNVEVDNDMNDPDVDWLTATKKPKVCRMILEFQFHI